MYMLYLYFSEHTQTGIIGICFKPAVCVCVVHIINALEFIVLNSGIYK